MEGKGYNTYGSFYEIGTYSSNRSVCSIVTERHVLKNTTPKLGPEEKATGPGLYSRAFQAPSQLEVDQIKAEYGPRQKPWLDRFPDSELYRAYSLGLEDTIVTSQGAESAMNAALANKIRRVEPFAMMKLNAEMQSRKFNVEKVYTAHRISSGLRQLAIFFACFMLPSITCRRDCIVFFRPRSSRGPGLFRRLSSRPLRG